MLKFDPDAHKKYATGFAARKQERREYGKQKRKAHDRTSFLESKRMRREDQRLIYNQNCHVPITQNYMLAGYREKMDEDKALALAKKKKQEVVYSGNNGESVVVCSEPLHEERRCFLPPTTANTSSSSCSAQGWTLPSLLHNNIHDLKKKTLQPERKVPAPRTKGGGNPRSKAPSVGSNKKARFIAAVKGNKSTSKPRTKGSKAGKGKKKRAPLPY
eukprot:NODE_2544_length_774_cov_221.564138_g1775_i0.p1 GENE.NODE_2544_length_774_cov_221.564138_g1775_i0~~NODE_2544_length_774_cov_221.564138_g1775_i0.p1  ORF type:complete len:216 (+),score=58.88 NODE_2544_length_774_cov_221.564138_g1775_i0:66-713(+)